MLEWIAQNRDWVFSGAGVAVVTATVALIKWATNRKRSTTPQPIASTSPLNTHYLGRWNCYWSFVVPQGRQPLTDSITFTKLDSDRLEGYGDNPDVGHYLVKGQIWQHALSLTFYGSNMKEDLVGLILLQKEPLRNKLRGEWLQLISTGQIAKGKTEWDKVLT